MANFGPETESRTIQHKYRNGRVPYHVGIKIDVARVCVYVLACVCFLSVEGGRLRVLTANFPVR
jgi:hypothetical protein